MSGHRSNQDRTQPAKFYGEAVLAEFLTRHGQNTHTILPPSIRRRLYAHFQVERVGTARKSEDQAEKTDDDQQADQENHADGTADEFKHECRPCCSLRYRDNADGGRLIHGAIADGKIALPALSPAILPVYAHFGMN